MLQKASKYCNVGSCGSKQMTPFFLDRQGMNNNNDKIKTEVHQNMNDWSYRQKWREVGTGLDCWSKWRKRSWMHAQRCTIHMKPLAIMMCAWQPLRFRQRLRGPKTYLNSQSVLELTVGDKCLRGQVGSRTGEYTGWRTKCHTIDCARNTFLLLQKHSTSGTELILIGWKIVPNEEHVQCDNRFASQPLANETLHSSQLFDTSLQKARGSTSLCGPWAALRSLASLASFGGQKT